MDYRPGTQAVALDTQARQVRTAAGGPLSYEALVIATGSRLYAPLPGAELPGVYDFKSLRAAEALMDRVRRGEAESALIVGAGFIGVEIAVLLRELGLRVVQLEMTAQVMPRMLDLESAAFALQILQEKGVDVRLGTEAKTFVGEKRVEGVQLSSGETLSADLYVAATGVRPNLQFLEGSGVEYRWGITVDNHLRTSAPEVYAAGDVVEAPDRLTGEPYVHAIFPNATAQGRVVGLNLAGVDTPYDGAERMNSLKHLGLPILAVGLKEGDEVLRTRVDGGLRTIYLQDGRAVGYQLVGDMRPAGALRSMMTRGTDVRRLKDALLEPHFGQGELVWRAMGLAA